MKYAILVLLLLMFGCTQPSESGEVTRIDMEDNSGDSSGSAATGNQTESSTSASVTKPSELEWNTECDDSYDCTPFDDRNACIKGNCVKLGCIFRADCKEKDHCFHGTCYTESELYEEFPQCGVNVACSDSCEGCKSGKRKCIMTGWSDGDDGKEYYVCAECGSSDYDCAEGYKCVQSYCVKGPN